MTYEQLYWVQGLQEAYGDKYDSSMVPVWYSYWSDYEENGWSYVLEKDGQFYILSYRYSVMADDNECHWDPYPVTEAEALEHMLSWEALYEDVRND